MWAVTAMNRRLHQKTKVLGLFAEPAYAAEFINCMAMTVFPRADGWTFTLTKGVHA